jgi:hypothetical protein
MTAWLMSAEEIDPDGRRPWTVNDGELARQIWAELKPDMQEFLQVLMEDSQSRLTLREIAQRMPSRPKRLHPGILGQAGSLCKRHGMQRLWRYPPQPYKLAVYWMEETVADLLSGSGAEPAEDPTVQS